MSPFYYRKHDLWVESVALASIAESVGTPCYVYSKSHLLDQCGRFKAALKDHSHRIFYAMKANSNLSLLQILKNQGCGFDIVSGGELARALKAGAAASHIVFSGVGKSSSEISTALEAGVGCFNIESRAELHRVNTIAEALGVKAPIALRINPDISAQSHPYISTGLKENKFGIPYKDALLLYKEAHALSAVNIKGLACHIGSQLTQLAPFLDALNKLKPLLKEIKHAGIALQHLDLGGGLGVRYTNEQPPLPEEYINALVEQWPDPTLELWLEPGRVLVAEAGALVTRVEYIKENEGKRFCIVDAGMNDLIRPALYSAKHAILELNALQAAPLHPYDVAGPICESSDLFASEVPLAINEGDYLAIQTAGAYGFSMSSQYNSRPRPVEVLVDGSQFRVIRERESIEDLFSHEQLLSD